MIKNILFSFVLLLSVPLNAQQLYIRDVFKQMPDSVMPYLTGNNRLDMLDFMDSKMKATVTNTLQGQSCLEYLSDSYLRIVSDSTSIFEMKLLPSSSVLSDTTKQVICVVHTYGSSSKESDITFYTGRWHQLSLTIPIDSYKQQMFVKPDTMSSVSYDSISEYKNDVIVCAKLSATENTIILQPSIPLLELDEKKKLEYVLCPKTLKWNGETFK